MDRLLPGEISDVDDIAENRRGAVSVFNGPEPDIGIHESADTERAAISAWPAALRQEGYAPHAIGVFVRSEAETERAAEAVRSAGMSFAKLGERAVTTVGSVAVVTMRLAKGLEFRAVAVAACDDEILPLQSRIESVADEADLKDTYETERHLLYVSMSLARAPATAFWSPV